MAPIHSSWELASWARAEGDPPERIAPSVVAEFAAKVADAPDDRRVMLTAGMLRALLAAHERPAITPGAAITDTDRRVTYLATIERGEGRVWLRTVEVIPHDGEPDPRVFRVPAQAVADMTAVVLAQQAETAAVENVEPSDVLLFGEPAPREGIPSPEELRDLLRQGETRRTIAARYFKSKSRVDDWLREARRERPDLDWPPRRRGPQPKTPDGKPAGSRERKNGK